MFGSDWPFYPQAMGLAKVLLATENDAAARTRVLRGNATTLLRAVRSQLGNERPVTASGQEASWASGSSASSSC